MADLQRSRPSLRRRILGAFEPLLTSSSSPTSPSSPAMPSKVLRKKRRGPSTSPRPDIPQAYRSNERSRSPFGRMLQRHRAASSDDAPATSTSSRSSSELHTPSSPGKHVAWDPDSPASSRSSLHRSNCVHGPKPVRASNPATVVAHDLTGDQHNGISFPVEDRHDESRPHSSSDYYRLPQTGGNLPAHVGGHMRCFSQPNAEPVRRTGLTVHQQPSTLSLRSVDLNRDLPPLPFNQDKRVPPLPISRSTTSGSSDADEDDEDQDDFLLAPGTFARVVGEDEDENDDLDELCRHTADGCSDHCCKPATLPLSLVIGPTGVSRRNSLPASLEGLKFVQAKLHDITPCDETPRAAETAIFARSPGAAPRHRLTPAMKEALVQDGQRQSFLSRAASLTRATTFTLKNVRTPRSLRRPGVPARIDEDARIAAA